jgi:hypothetical protein
MSSVDVIVPCYGYGHFLEECVASVLAQPGPSVRVLVVDDASPDHTKEVATELAQHDSRVTVLRHSSNRGHIATYNEGIEWASAKYLLLLSADDYLLPGALHRAVMLLERYGGVSFAFGNAVELDEHGARRPTETVVSQKGERILTGQEFILLSGARNIVATATAVVRTEVQKKVGGYVAELPHAGDMEMWLRLAGHGSVGFVQEPQAVYRRHANNMSLSYTAQHWLPDLEQRSAAFDCFFRTCGDMVPNLGRLHGRLLYLLACEAVGHASAAFNDDRPDVCEQLSSFALRVCPRVTKSLHWARLACKRRMGLKMWRALQPVTDAVRWVRDFECRTGITKAGLVKSKS